MRCCLREPEGVAQSLAMTACSINGLSGQSAREAGKCYSKASFRRTNEKLGAETGDFVTSYKSAVADVGMSRRAVGSGDIMVLCSACMYAFSIVLQEKLLKQGCTVEALGILGVFGTLISVLQAWSLGWTRFVEVTWTSPMALSVFGFSDVLLRYVWAGEYLLLCGRCREPFVAQE